MKLGHKLHNDTLPSKLREQLKTDSMNTAPVKKHQYNTRHIKFSEPTNGNQQTVS